MSDVLRTVSTRRTPQSQPAGGATTRNAAGGHVFAVDDVTRLRRFLTLGTEAGTYYTKAPELTRQNAEVVIRMAQNDARTLVDTVVEISLSGRAPKPKPAIFALAIAASLADDEGRTYALSKLNAVCRTGTHLYDFATYIKQFRGWGRGLKRAVGNWYTSKPVDKEAYQLLKYRQREGWMHRDLLRLSRPDPGSRDREALHDYLMIEFSGKREPSARALAKFGDAARSKWYGRHADPSRLPDLVNFYETAKVADVGDVVSMISCSDLSWEMLPDEMLGKPEVWEALLHKGMPQTALMRQLPRLTRLGLTTGATGNIITAQLTDAERLKRGRVHPVNVLVAARTYASGASARGSSSWTPTSKVVDAFDAAFYAAYGAVEPAGKPILLALDVSGSMGQPAGGLPITCREAGAALALVTLNTESDAEVIGFSDGRAHSSYNLGGYTSYNSIASRLDISSRRRLDDVCRYTASLDFGRTDCALPMLWAMQNKLDFDCIQVITDSETWFGNIHPHQALRQYREHVGHDVKFVVVAMTSTGYSIADPNDASSLDVVGFDAAVPQLISDFSAGRI
jgi:60 kDa SS-A/Ro ribonucleoprotein